MPPMMPARGGEPDDEEPGGGEPEDEESEGRAPGGGEPGRSTGAEAEDPASRDVEASAERATEGPVDKDTREPVDMEAQSLGSKPAALVDELDAEVEAEGKKISFRAGSFHRMLSYALSRVYHSATALFRV